MDIATITQEAAALLEAAADWIPPNLKSLLGAAASAAVSSIDIGSSFKFILVFAAALLGAGLLVRLLFGNRSDLNHAMSSSAGILTVYVLTVIIYAFQPKGLENLLSPLPFVTFVNDYLFVLPFRGTSFETLCSQILALVILSFVVNCMDALLPEGENPFTWFLSRFLSVILAMGLHVAANWAINKYLPTLIVYHAPAVLLVILLSCLLLGVFKLILGIFLTVVNPVLGALYTFFFSSHIGKQLTKSVLSTAILCGVFYVMDRFSYLIVHISPAALPAYLPLLPGFLVIWYLLGHAL